MKHLLFVTTLFLAANAFPLLRLRAADPEKPSGYTLQCDMVPVKDVIVQKGAGIKIVGSDPSAMEEFELHALIAWSTPQLDETGRKLVFSGSIVKAYLVKVDPAPKIDQEHVFRAKELHGAPVAHTYGWTPLHPVKVVTTVSLDDPQSKKMTIRYDFADGKRTASGNGFSLETVAGDNDVQHGYEFEVYFNGSFTLDGTQYESYNGAFGGSAGVGIEFDVKAQPIK